MIGSGTKRGPTFDYKGGKGPLYPEHLLRERKAIQLYQRFVKEKKKRHRENKKGGRKKKFLGVHGKKHDF